MQIAETPSPVYCRLCDMCHQADILAYLQEPGPRGGLMLCKSCECNWMLDVLLELRARLKLSRKQFFECRRTLQEYGL